MIKWSKFATKAKFYASQGASKMGLGVKERFKLSMKVQKAKKKLSNKAFDIKKGATKVGKKYKKLSTLEKGTIAAIGGFGLGASVGALGEDPKSYNYKNKRVNQRTLERAKKVKMYG